MKGFLATLLFSCLAAVPASAGAALLYDAGNGRVLYAEDADQPWYPASLTKMMTAYLLFEHWATGKAVPEDKITVSTYANSQPPSRLGLGAGRTLSLDDAAKALIAVSANDIAVSIAEALAGSEEAFVEKMNSTAHRLGMYGTRFLNPHGLPGEGQYTTAKDLALLTQALLRDFPDRLGYFSMVTGNVGKRVIGSHNTILTTVSGGDGMKTGYTCSAGYNIVASASRDGHRLVAVVLGEASKSKRAIRARDLLEWGFMRRDWKALFAEPTVWSLPETSFDRQSMRALNLGKRYSDCLDPVPEFILAAADVPVTAAAPSIVAGAAVSAALAAARSATSAPAKAAAPLKVIKKGEKEKPGKATSSPSKPTSKSKTAAQ